MLESSDESYRSMKGSLSNRGCYLDAEGKVLKDLKSFPQATHFLCLDCGKKEEKIQECQIVESVSDKKVIRPLCSICYEGRL